MMKISGSVQLALIVATCCLAGVVQVRGYPVHGDNALALEHDVELKAPAKPSDAEETEHLQANYQGFSDFCLSTRDGILNEFIANGKGAAGNFAKTVFDYKVFGQEDHMPRDVSNHFKKIMVAFAKDDSTRALKVTCDHIEQYEQGVREHFQQAKEQLVARDPSLANVALDDVNCLTTARLTFFNGFCKASLKTMDSLLKFYKANYAPANEQ